MMQEEQTAVLVRACLECFDERDQVKRLSIIQGALHSRKRFFEMDGNFRGYDAINHRVTEVLQSLPACALFQMSSSITSNHKVVRLVWTLNVEGGEVLAGGMDVSVLGNCRIAELYVFIDSNPAVG